MDFKRTHGPAVWLYLLTTGLGLVLICFAWLRETPSFWRNASGSPLWLRSVIAVSFYPLLVFYLGLLVSLSLKLWKKALSSTQPTRAEASAVLLLWITVAIVLVIIAKNNVENFFAERPLHSHVR
jgi:hypothetical protein